MLSLELAVLLAAVVAARNCMWPLLPPPTHMWLEQAAPVVQVALPRQT